MAKHEPFPIADFQEGLSLPKEPWLSPRNAFRELENARVYRGRIENRTGFSLFAELASGTAETYVTNHSAVGPSFFYYTANPATEWPVYQSLTFRFDTTGGTGPPYINAETNTDKLKWIEEDNLSGTGNWNLERSYANTYEAPLYETGTTTQIGMLWYAPDPANTNIPAISGSPHTGVKPIFAAVVRWDLHSAYVGVASNGGEIGYRLNPQTEVIGLDLFDTNSGTFSLAADKTKLYKYNTTTRYYEELGSTTFTGTDDDYFWFWPFDDYILLTNGIDPVQRWDPTAAIGVSVTEQPTNFDGSPGNDIDAALLVIRFKGRAVYLHTTEGANIHPRRARFSAPGAYDTFDEATDWVDAPADFGDIVTAEFIGERCFVGFETGWMELVSTGDAIAPFEWRPFISRFGAVSKLSTIKDNERLLSRSKTTMQALDPNGQRYLDSEIPDYVRNFSPEFAVNCAAHRNEDRRSFWWTAVSIENTGSLPDKVLNATYDEKGQIAWSVHTMSMNVFSSFDSEETPTWDSLGPLTWDDYTEVTWNDASIGAEGFEQTIGGAGAGAVYVFDNSNRDQYLPGHTDIDMAFKSERLSPYPGRSSHMGWIDIMARNGGTLTLSFYRDFETTAYKTEMIEFTEDSGTEKVIRRIPVNMTATFHTIEGFSDSRIAVAIDAFIPWFRPGARLRKIS